MAENDAKTQFSPAWWMKVLTGEQSERLVDKRTKSGDVKPGLNTLQAWLDNNPPLPEDAPVWKAAMQAFYKDTRTNVAALAVSSVRDRLTPLGFRTAASDDDNGDDVARRVWSENQMEVQQVDLLTWMLGLSDSYTMVGPPAKGDTIPIVTVEDPRDVITAHNPMRRREILAGIKTLHDPYVGQDICHVYLPADDRYNPTRATVFTARRKAPRGTLWNSGFLYADRQWTWDDEVVELPTKRVPIARLENRGGVAEFEPHLGLLGRINRITLQRMMIGEIQAFRQRAIKGLPTHWPEGHPLAGQEIDYAGIFDPGPGSLWQVPEGVDFWESQPIDIRPLLDEERMEFRTASAVMGIPVYYFNPDDTNGSAEGASTQRENLVYRAEDRRTLAESGLNLTMSLAFEMMDDAKRADLSQIEGIWAPVERLSLTERYDAAVKAKATGMPTTSIYREVLKLSPRVIKQIEADQARDMVLGIAQMAPTPGEAQALTARQPSPAAPPPRRVESTRTDQPAPARPSR